MPDPLRIFVVTGTSEFGFPWLLELCRDLAAEAGVDASWVVQRGPVDAVGGPTDAESFAFCDGDEYRAHLDAADGVIGHAGLGLVLDVLERGTPTVLVPRRRCFDEHVDDHQMQIARAIDLPGVVVASERADPPSWPQVAALLTGPPRPPVVLGNPRLTAAVAHALGLGGR